MTSTPHIHYRATQSSSSTSFINKLVPSRFQEKKRHESVQENDEDGLNNDWRDKVRIDDKYEENRPKVLKFSKELANMRNGHLDRITNEKYHNGLTSETVQTVHSRPYRDRPTARQYGVTEMNSML